MKEGYIQIGEPPLSFMMGVSSRTINSGLFGPVQEISLECGHEIERGEEAPAKHRYFCSVCCKRWEEKTIA